MTFLVAPPGRPPHSQAGFILCQDRWNDFSFRTQYQLYFGSGDGAPDLLGSVKILKLGQTASDGLQLSVGEFSSLGQEFCSVGQGLDYYERLAALGPDRRTEALVGLRDIVQQPPLVDEFKEQEGWRISLFRDFSLDADFLATAKALIDRDYDSLPNLHLDFTFHPTGWGEALKLDFSAPSSDLDDVFGMRAIKTRLPSRIAVLVGRNGSGKSTLLARLARVAHGSAGDRRKRVLAQLGELDPPGIGFTRIVAISYSAFDSFIAPGLTPEERVQVGKEIRTGTGRYMFCGLRDIGRELDDLSAIEREEGDRPETPEERLATNRLKSLDSLTDEFAAAIAKIGKSDRLGMLRRCTAPLFLDPSLYAGEGADIFQFMEGDLKANFHALSTGHKIVLHVIASVVSHLERKSLVLFDEPETHLHPPLLAALMHGLRLALHDLDAFAIVATHSPVVVQETLSRHVHKVVRNGDSGRIFPPEIETFGESIGTITNEVFALDATSTDYHVVLRGLAQAYGDLGAIEAALDRGLSTQARAFVMSVLAEPREGQA